MKKVSIFLIMFLFLMLAGCQFNKTTYNYNGEVYLKSRVSNGDEGNELVVDIEIEKKEYDLNENNIIPVKVGCGHLPDHDGLEQIAFVVELYYNNINEPYNRIENNIIDFNSITYYSTVPNNKSFLFIPFYDDFFPTYHEKHNLEIPKESETGYIKVALQNEYLDFSIKLDYTVKEGKLIFKTDY